MGMTMSQKILAAHAGLEQVSAGQLIEAKVDLVLANDITAPVAIKELQKAGLEHIFHQDKIALVLDHLTPNRDIKAAEQCRLVRNFAKEKGITHFYDVGEMGIEHALLPEKGLTAPGELIIGADSHTCTYGALGAFSTGMGSTDIAAAMATGKSWFKVPAAQQFILSGKLPEWSSGKDVILYIIGKIGVSGALYQSMEFTGEGVDNLTLTDRFTIANMAIEAGAKNGIFPVDTKTQSYCAGRVTRPYQVYTADEDACYEAIHTIDLSTIRPVVALPHLPENIRFVDELNPTPIDQVVIGSCTNGRLEDLEVAAKILQGKKIKKGVRTIIFPATQEIYLEAIRKGYIETFIEAGAAVSTPTCGPCLGGHCGILGKGERVVATTNRNFVGRMGHSESEVYLTNPAVAAASALAGIILTPAQL